MQLSVGRNSVWGVRHDGSVMVRVDIEETEPFGKEWFIIDGQPMTQVSTRSRYCDSYVELE